MITDEKAALVKQAQYQDLLDVAAQRRLVRSAYGENAKYNRHYSLGRSWIRQRFMHLAHDVSAMFQSVRMIISFRGRENCESC